SVRHVPEQIRLRTQAERRKPIRECVAQRPLAADQEPPTVRMWREGCQDVGQDQGVLLGLEPPDAQNLDRFAIIRASDRLLYGHDLLPSDQGGVDLEPGPYSRRLGRTHLEDGDSVSLGAASGIQLHV